VLDDGARARLRAQWRELFESFDAVICPIMPTPPYPHDHSAEQEKRRVNIDGRITSIRINWPGPASPACPRPGFRLGCQIRVCGPASQSSGPGWKTARR
jgi:amidase